MAPIGIEEVSVVMSATTDNDQVLRLPEISTPRCVGRQRELAALERALARPPAVVLVEGEAGIGKSRLLREFLATPQVDPHSALLAACPPFRESLTLGPVVDAVRQARQSVAGLPLSALAGALRPLFPEWAMDLPAALEPLEDPKAGRHRLFRALAELLECLGADVLVVEDVHWADEVTLEFLLFLTSRPPSRTVSVVVTYRPEDLPAGSLVLRLSSRPPADMSRVRIALEPLDVVGTASLVSSMLDDDPVSEAFATFLHERTDGLPLAVEESIRLLCDRADLVREGGQWARRSLEELQVPPTVRDAVLERVPRLGPAARCLLQAASVLAEPSSEAVICEVAGLTGDEARAGLGEAVASGLLWEVEGQRFVFRHSLMGRAVYEALPGPERRRLHMNAGRALERAAPQPVVRLTRHFREADEVAKWCRYAEEAADLAIESGDHNAAVSRLYELLTADVAMAASVRARLARNLGAAALLRMQDIDDVHLRVIDALRAVLAADRMNLVEQAEIRNPLGRLLMQCYEWEAGSAELEQAVGHLGHVPGDQARAMIALAWPFGGSWPASEHLQWARRAADVDDSALSPIDRLGVTADRSAALLLLGDRDGWAVADDLPVTASSAVQRRQIARGCSNIAVAALVWGRYAEASRRLVIAQQIADAEGYLAISHKTDAMLAELDWLTGAWGSLAERLAGLMDDTHPPGPPTFSGVLLVAGSLATAHGLWSVAEEHLRHALESAGQRGQAHDAVPPAAALGRLRLAEGRVAEALRLTEEPISLIARKGVWVWATEVAPVRVEALAGAGRADEAARLVADFAHGLRGCDAPAPRAALATCRAILIEGAGEYARAARSFARAARAWDRLPRPYDALRARERQASCLLAAGRFESGLALLSQLYSGLVDLGARGDADRVAGQLREHGVVVRRPWRGGPKGYGDQLSPRELDVVRLVVAGRTRREIAEVLSKSPRTVDAQVRSAMRKLNVSSRAALAVGAVEAGIVPGASFAER